jgi:hypothetical protein
MKYTRMEYSLAPKKTQPEVVKNPMPDLNLGDYSYIKSMLESRIKNTEHYLKSPGRMDYARRIELTEKITSAKALLNKFEGF